MTNSEIKQVIKTVIPETFWSDSEQDNTFIRANVFDTFERMQDLNYVPLGVHIDENLGPDHMYQLVFQKDGLTRWVHVPKSMMGFIWLKQLNMLPPDEYDWDDGEYINWFVWGIGDDEKYKHYHDIELDDEMREFFEKTN